MSTASYSSYTQWYCEGHLASYARSMKSSGGMLNLLEGAPPAGDMSDPPVPDLALHYDVMGDFGITADLGSGRFSATCRPGNFLLAAPNFANSVIIDNDHHIRTIAFPIAYWTRLLEDTPHRASFLDFGALHRGPFTSPIIQSAQRNLWRLCDEEGAPSRLLAQAAGCEILAELCRLVGSPFASARGGLAPWAKRRSLELMQARLAEDISLDELAAEARLSAFHFARMFKQSVGVPPLVYLTRLRMEKICELLAMTDLTVTEIAQEVGYSSNQVLARVFMKHQLLNPTEYRRAVREPRRYSATR